MPRRKYSDLGYITFRGRHVIPVSQGVKLDAVADRLKCDRATAMDFILAAYFGQCAGLGLDPVKEMGRATEGVLAETIA